MSKYGAIRTTIDGLTFDSKSEAARYEQLRLLVRNGDIEQLTIHPVFPLIVEGQKIGKYIADFMYYEGGVKIVEDVKGFLTREYRIKKKLVKALYGIDILETKG